jgi:quercetin dioxygenase-like cupin family protein
MKQLFTLLLLALPFLGFAQNASYTLSSYHIEGTKAPNTHYLGEAWLGGVLQADATLPYNITKATFKANSTLDWHKHSGTQVLIIVSGEGYYQEKGKDPIRIKEGDVLKCEPNTEHWHSSSKEKDVTYLALYSGGTEWTEVLSQEAYDRVAQLLAGKK